ncbi:uncharacterized protein LOC117263686 [Epinephelus lanceolatus]
MCKVQMLRALVKQRLTAAAEEIFGLFERTIAEYEEQLCRSKEENERQRKLLDAVYNGAEVQQQLLVVKEEVPPEQQEWSSSVDQEDPEPPHIKEEEEELWSSQEGEQLQGLEEADITKFTFTPVPVKSEDDEEEPQSEGHHCGGPGPVPGDSSEADGEDCGQPGPSRDSDPDAKEQLQELEETRTEEMETETDEEDCGGPEPAINSDPNPNVKPDTEDKNRDSSEPETDDSCDWTETRKPECPPESAKLPFRDWRYYVDKTVCSCSECGKTFNNKTNLKVHMLIHMGEKPFSCIICSKRFSTKPKLIRHMRRHPEDKPFSCPVCQRRYRFRGDVDRHMRVGCVFYDIYPELQAARQENETQANPENT